MLHDGNQVSEEGSYLPKATQHGAQASQLSGCWCFCFTLCLSGISELLFESSWLWVSSGEKAIRHVCLPTVWSEGYACSFPLLVSLQLTLVLDQGTVLFLY